MNNRTKKNQIRTRRAMRTRARIFGTAAAPRLSVFRSNRLSYVQLIDDDKGHTLAAVSANDLSAADRKKPKVAQAYAMGELLAEKAHAAGIAKAVFDRGAYRYHGRVAAVAEGARKGGLAL